MIQVQPVQHKYSPEQPRDPEGRFGEGVSHQPRLSAELDPSTEARALDMLTRGGKTPDLHSQPVRVAAKVQGMQGMADVIEADPTKLAVFRKTFGSSSREMLEQQIRKDVSRWASTASDSNEKAVVMQRVAMELFATRPDGYAALLTSNRVIGGGEQGQPWRTDFATRVDTVYAQYADWDRVFLTAMYANTQKILAAHRIDHLTLYRSMGWQHGGPAWAKDAKDGGTIDVPMQPIASWAATRHQAEHFNGSMVGYGSGVVLSTNVPASRIIATPFTGFGALMEHEFVTADTPGDMLVHKFGKS